MTTHNDARKMGTSRVRSLGTIGILVSLLVSACGDGAEEGASDPDPMGSGGIGTGGASNSGGAMATGGAPSTGGALATGGITGVGGSEATGGNSATGGSGTGGDALGTGGEESGTGGVASVDLTTYAAGLDELFLDRPCEEGVTLPQPNGAVCLHRSSQHAEEDVTFGGESGTTYSVTLRVRGIWEPTNIEGGTVPDPSIPYMVGGNVAPGSGDSAAINYQQFYIEVSSPAQTYWLNEHNHVGHEIFKEDYEITIPIEGGATVTVVANDGNEREIANFSEEIFTDMPPYDQMPTVGQFLRLDVMGVEVAP